MTSLRPVASFFCPNKLSGGPSSCFAITIWPKCQLLMCCRRNLFKIRDDAHHTPHSLFNVRMVPEIMRWYFLQFVLRSMDNWKTTIVSSLDDKLSVRYLLALERLSEYEDEGSRSDVNSTMDCLQPRRGSLCSIRLTVEQGEPSKNLR